MLEPTVANTIFETRDYTLVRRLDGLVGLFERGVPVELEWSGFDTTYAAIDAAVMLEQCAGWPGGLSAFLALCRDELGMDAPL